MADVIAIGNSLEPASAYISTRTSISPLDLIVMAKSDKKEEIKYYTGVTAGPNGIVTTGETIGYFSYGSDFTVLKGKYVYKNGEYYKIPSTANIVKTARQELVSLEGSYEVRISDGPHNKGYLIEQKDGQIIKGQVRMYDIQRYRDIDEDMKGKYLENAVDIVYNKVGNNPQYIHYEYQGANPLYEVKITCSSYYFWYKIGDIVLIYTDLNSRPVPYVMSRNISANDLIGKYYKDNNTKRKITGVIVQPARYSGDISNVLTDCCPYYIDDVDCNVTIESQKIKYYPQSFGIEYEFDEDSLMELRATQSVGIAGDELMIDTMTPEVHTDAQDPREIKYGTPVWWLRDGELYNKYFFRGATRGEKYKYMIDTMSIIGLFQTRESKGGLYKGELIPYVISELIGDVTLKYVISSVLGNVPVYGWLPYDTVRNNLHRLMMAYNISILRSDDNPENIVFNYLGRGTVTSIQNDKIFINGNTDYKEIPTVIEVTEHAFIEPYNEDGYVELFNNVENGIGADHLLVKFSTSPIYRLRTSGELSIKEKGVNYAVVSGIGILQGLPYIHQTKINSVRTDAEGEEITETITDDCLITLFNAQNVINRLLAYYNHTKIVNMDMILDNERCGNRYSFYDPFDELIPSAVLAKMDINSTSFVRANCEFISGVGFTGQGNIYTNVDLLTEDGTYIVPSDVTKIRVVLIGGGDGGESGFAGAPGKTAVSKTGSEGGEGGKAGNPGKGGRIYSVDINVTPGQVFSYTIGSAGIGGNGDNSTHDSNIKGTNGGNTTFGNYTSLQGFSSDAGFMEIINNEKYAYHNAEKGVGGGNGGKGGDCVDTNSETIENIAGMSGDNASVYFGGEKVYGTDFIGYYQNYGADIGYLQSSGSNIEVQYSERIFGCGGSAGGAFGITNPNNGTIPHGSITRKSQLRSDNVYIISFESTVVQGKGGDGSKPTKPQAQTIYGCGGSPGHGGGGGGGSGGINTNIVSVQSKTESCTSQISTMTEASASVGGKGGDGGDGAPGCIFVYY